MMKKLLMLALFSCIVAIAIAQVTLTVYEVDGETVFDGRDIMVGSELVFVVSSDANDYWSGALFVEGQDRALGTLYGRDYDPNTRDYTGSYYESAGESARVWAWKDSYIWGFDLYTSETNTSDGNWFVIDYEADNAGVCDIDFYDYGISWNDPNYTVSLTNILPQDLNDDNIVNLIDFSLFVPNWLAEGCIDPNWCGGADMTFDGTVDCNDLAFFAEYWLWGAPEDDSSDPNESGGRGGSGDSDASEERDEFGDPIPTKDPYTVYSIVDIYDSNEITMDLGSTVTLYVKLTTYKNNIVYLFHSEVDISNPKLGSIDNTAYGPCLYSSDNIAYGPDKTQGKGTARILISPRWFFFDNWGPGIKQAEGIRLFGVSADGATISDGHLASFEFTCDGEGDVTLNLVDWMSEGQPVYPVLKSMIIHQVDPNSPQVTQEE